MRGQRPVFIGIKGTVLALDRATGEELWRTSLKGGSFVNLVESGSDLLASTQGEVFCLDPADGEIRWNNSLRGMGWGIVSFAGSPPAPPAEQQRRQAAAASSAAM